MPSFNAGVTLPYTRLAAVAVHTLHDNVLGVQHAMLSTTRAILAGGTGLVRHAAVFSRHVGLFSRPESEDIYNNTAAYTSPLLHGCSIRQEKSPECDRRQAGRLSQY